MKTSYLINYRIGDFGFGEIAIDVNHETNDPACKKYEQIKKELFKELSKEYDLENELYGVTLKIISVNII